MHPQHYWPSTFIIVGPTYWVSLNTMLDPTMLTWLANNHLCINHFQLFISASFGNLSFTPLQLSVVLRAQTRLQFLVHKQTFVLHYASLNSLTTRRD